MIDTHGIPMYGLEAASRATIDWPNNSRHNTQISYDLETGDIITSCHIGESCTQRSDPHTIAICITYGHMDAQEIADNVAEVVKWMETL